MGAGCNFLNGTSQPADEQIVRQVLAGERELFEVIVRRHGQRLYRIAVSIVRNTTDAEDVVQETFINAYRHLSQFAGRSSFLTWLARITTNISLHRASCTQRESGNLPLDTDEAIPLASAAPTPEECAVSAASCALVREAVSELGEKQRSVLTLRDLQEVDTATTAKVLGITEQNVKVRLHRARRALRQKLEARLPARPSLCAALGTAEVLPRTALVPAARTTLPAQ